MKVTRAEERRAASEAWEKFASYRPSPTLRQFHLDGNAIERGEVDMETGKVLRQQRHYIRMVCGPIGCLDGETEVLTRGGWVKIGAWDGEEILEWDAVGGRAFFARPVSYHTYACDWLNRFERGTHWEMTVSDGHRIPLYRPDGTFVVRRGSEVAKHVGKYRVPTTWEPESDGVGMSDDELRLWVAIAADGCYPRVGKQCMITLRRERKVVRLRELLGRLGVSYTERVSARRPTERRITFARPNHPKHFDWRLSAVNRHQAEVMVEELRHWDGLYGYDYDRFDSTCVGDVEIVQFLAHSAGRVATIRKQAYANARWHPCYSVHIAKIGSAKNGVWLRSDGTRVRKVRPSDGRMYCFTTHTGFFVVRERGNVYVTGNSGKSVACCMEIMFRAMQQNPGPDGVRRSRIAVVRDTYKNLRDTTLQTWLSWFPEGAISKVVWTPTVKVYVDFPMSDGTRVHLELFTLALDSDRAMEDLKSLEISGFWVNECQAIRLSLINQLTMRVGRYPGGTQTPRGGTVNYGIGDTNPPNIGSWYYELAEVKHPVGWTFYRQPPALLYEEVVDENGPHLRYEPNTGQREGVLPAENIEHLDEGFLYYLKGLGSQSDEFTKVYICGEYGDSSGGKPVYPGYRDDSHYREEGFAFKRGSPLILGFDYGTTPACVICQLNDRGQLRVLEEVIGDNTYMTEFFDCQVKPRLVNEYGWGNGLRLYAVGDPSGDFRKDTDGTTAALVLRERGVPVIPCLTNAISPRIEAVRLLLSKRSDGRTPDLMISGKCKVLREGFLGNYRFAPMKGFTTTRMRELPEKNEYSHVHDALQYAAHLIANPNDYSVDLFGLAMGGQTPDDRFSFMRGRSGGRVDLSGII